MTGLAWKLGIANNLTYGLVGLGFGIQNSVVCCIILMLFLM